VIDINTFDVTKIQQRLASVQTDTSFREQGYPFLPDPPRPAAVLIPLHQPYGPANSPPAWHILLTKRSNQLTEHSGQVAFPGGRSDPNDSSPEETALREAYEEIGLEAHSVLIIGRLRNFSTITNYCITPIIGVINTSFDYKPVSTEVERVFSIPLSWLADSNNYEIRQRIIPEQYSSLIGEQSFPVIYFHPYEGEILWGVSAELTLQLIKALTIESIA
jgi:8-oxo-dGTP pyrophosphatase MutT (NUDIX family)